MGKLCLIVFLSMFSICSAWDQSDIEIFDLVEEINQNFYDVLGVLQNCSQSEIRKAYRRLSLQLHPDKNDAPDAEVKFRQLVGVYEILRDGAKRARYDQVLVEGLPNWRNPLYYYRRVRKMGMLELSIWLFVLFSIGQYGVAWGSYFEKKLTLDEVKASKLKKLQKQIKKKKQPNEYDVEEELDQLFIIPKPSYKNTLPFQIFNMIISLPAFCRWLVEYRKEKKREALAKKEQERLEAEEEERMKEEMEREKEMKKGYRRKRAIPLPSYTGEAEERILEAVDEPCLQQSETKFVRVNTGPWTDDDLTELAKLMKKYPVGTAERWEKIAEALNRTVTEVTHFARKLKDNAFRPLEGQEVDANSKEEERVEKKKEKTRGGKNNILLAEPTQANYGIEGAEEQVPGSSGWTQKQQKSLETALACYTKGCSERWERIAKAVPDKTKEECMLRVKYLSDLVKKKKQMEEEKLRAEQEGEQQQPTQLNEKQESEKVQTT
ncbi:dnaJ homolog subfamily C member 1-like [Daphnia carinata]|uniref:dnaJ homolog subfamily C member 1-like n=1 Tax=Daphnia carinata TaxID=120202 RepID=UPI00257D8A7E|nr:dnaJ homolog subfamily C member 1-like [Daphnia carinata]